MSTKLKLRGAARFLASIFDGIGITVRKDGLATYIDLDFTQFPPLASYNPSAQNLIAQSTVDGSYGLVTISQIIASSQTEHHIRRHGQCGRG